MPAAEMQILQGMGVSSGIAIGRAVCIETRGPDVFRFHIAEDQVETDEPRRHPPILACWRIPAARRFGPSAVL